MNRTLAEWIELYERKTRVKYEADNKYRLFYFADRGFAEFKATDNMIIVNQMCGDGKFWKNVAEVLAIERGIKHLGTWCIRNVKAYIKFWGFEIVEVEDLRDGRKRYYCRDKSNGKNALVSPAFTINGVDGYMVTWEI